MASIKIQSSSSGGGSITLTAPTTSSNRTVTLPDEDVTLGGGGITYLGALTLSGSSSTLSNLTLTSYKFLRLDFIACRLSSNNTWINIGTTQSQGARAVFWQGTGAGVSTYGGFSSTNIDLTTGYAYSTSTRMCNINASTGETAPAETEKTYAGGTRVFITHSSTSVPILARSGYTLAAGSVKFWGIK
jgi:hypothetical protein